MRVVIVSNGTEIFIDDIMFTEAVVSAYGITIHLAPELQKTIDAGEEYLKLERRARQAVTRAQALVEVVDNELDLLTMRFSRSLLNEVGNNREDVLYTRFFATNPSDFIRTGLRAQVDVTVKKFIPELEKLPDASPLKQYLPQFQSVSEQALQRLDQRLQATIDRSRMYHEILEWKEGVNKLRTSIYAEIIKIAMDNHLPRAWAEIFFKKERPNRNNEEEETQDAETK